MTTNNFTLGWIPYWNLFPLKQEIVRHWGQQVELIKGHPTVVNRALNEGRAALGPCSSICLLTNPGQEMALPLGIASSGPVQSVYLAIKGDRDLEAEFMGRIAAREAVLREMFQVAQQRFGDDMRGAAAWVWEQAHIHSSSVLAGGFLVPTLRLTQASAASAAMVRVLYHLWFGAEGARALLLGQESDGCDNGRLTLDLLIGDEALMRRPSYHHVYDLGETWWRLTGLPFVFAVWQKSAAAAISQGLFGIWRQRIWEVSEIAQARMKVDPSAYMPEVKPVDEAGREIDLAAYWRAIDYRLGTNHFKGLLLYLNLARNILAGIQDDQSVVRILRWQEWAHERSESH